MGQMKELDIMMGNGANTLVLHKDGRKEYRRFTTDASIRRYARSKKATQALRLHPEGGGITLVYNSESN
jgi:hypothetical protein